MDIKDIVERHSQLHSAIMDMESFKLGEPVTIEMLKMSRSNVLFCYRTMKSIGFKGNIFNFLSAVSMDFVQYSWILAADIVSTRKIDPLVLFHNEESLLRFYLMELAETCLRYPEDAKNMLRMVSQDPRRFFETDSYKEFRTKFKKFDEKQLVFLCRRVLDIVYLSYCFGYDDSVIINEINKELRVLSRQRIAQSGEITPRKALFLLPREKKVLQGIVEYLEKAGGNRIKSIKTALANHFAIKRVKISDATIFHSVKGLTEVGLLSIVDAELYGPTSHKARTYELDQNLLENSEILIKDGLLRTTLSPSVRIKQKGVSKKKK